jgi:hypothetical protein
VLKIAKDFGVPDAESFVAALPDKQRQELMKLYSAGETTPGAIPEYVRAVQELVAPFGEKAMEAEPRIVSVEPLQKDRDVWYSQELGDSCGWVSLAASIVAKESKLNKLSRTIERVMHRKPNPTGNLDAAVGQYESDVKEFLKTKGVTGMPQPFQLASVVSLMRPVIPKIPKNIAESLITRDKNQKDQIDIAGYFANKVGTTYIVQVPVGEIDKIRPLLGKVPVIRHEDSVYGPNQEKVFKHYTAINKDMKEVDPLDGRSREVKNKGTLFVYIPQTALPAEVVKKVTRESSSYK